MTKDEWNRLHALSEKWEKLDMENNKIGAWCLAADELRELLWQIRNEIAKAGGKQDV